MIIVLVKIVCLRTLRPRIKLTKFISDLAAPSLSGEPNNSRSPIVDFTASSLIFFHHLITIFTGFYLLILYYSSPFSVLRSWKP